MAWDDFSSPVSGGWDSFSSPVKAPIPVENTPKPFSLADAGANLLGGAVQGAANIGATALAPLDWAARKAGVSNDLIGREDRRGDVRRTLADLVPDVKGPMFHLGELASEIAGTAGVGGGLAKALAFSPKLATAVETGGWAADAPWRYRLAGGAAQGAAGATMVDPSSIGTGASTGALLAPVGSLVRGAAKGAGWLSDLAQSRLSERHAGRIARAATEGNQAAIEAANTAAPANLLAGQAAADVPVNSWQALAKVAEGIDPASYYSGVRGAQEAAQRTALEAGVGAGTQAEARQVAGGMKTVLNNRLDPVRMEELKAASEIDPAPIHGAIHRIVNDPNRAGAKIVNAVLGQVDDAIRKWTTLGAIDAEAIYSIRKNVVNDALDTMLSGDPKTKAKAAADALKEINPLIDKALGKSWVTRYLDPYAEGMREIERQQMSARMLELFNDSKKRFIKVAEGNKPKEVEKIFGRNKVDINQQMDTANIQDVASQLRRDQKVNDMAAAGMGNVENILSGESSNLRAPSLIHPVVSAINKGLSTIENKIDRNTMRLLTEGMRNGVSANKLLAMVPAEERNAVLIWLTKGGLGKYTAPLGAQQ